jgi:hypothetical protein
MTLSDRASLAGSMASSGYPLPSFSAPLSSCASVTSPDGLAGYFAGIFNVNINSREFGSGSASMDNGYLDNANYCHNLVVLQRNNTYSFSIDLWASNNEQVKMWIDYNNNGSFDNATELILAADNIPSSGSGRRVSGTFTVPGTAVTNSVLRLRVMDEVATSYHPSYEIVNACYDPRYGQAEDYPMFIMSVLPVEWKYFNGRKQDNDAILNWATANELNSKEFEIERSSDGNNFVRIATVTASNKPNGEAYTYIDKNALAPIYFYRLKQVDKDGKSKYSNIVVVRNEDNGAIKQMSVNNPFKNILEIRFGQALKDQTEIQLTDLSGRLIMKKMISAGIQSTIVDLTDKQVAAGLYILQVRTGNTVTTRKVVKQ